jgi:hypothetical protein
MRMHVSLSLGIALCSLVAAVGWLNGNLLAWRYLLNHPAPAGMFGAAAADLHRETRAEAQARVDRDREMLTELASSTRVSRVSATLSLLGSVCLVWIGRRSGRRRLLSSAGLALIALAVFVLVQVV